MSVDDGGEEDDDGRSTDQEDTSFSQIQGKDMWQGASYQLFIATRLNTSVLIM